MGAVMIQVILLHAAKKGESGIREVQSVVQPLFADVALYYSGEQDGHCVNRKEEADGCGDEE
jgi:hypothetical protein